MLLTWAAGLQEDGCLVPLGAMAMSPLIFARRHGRQGFAYNKPYRPAALRSGNHLGSRECVQALGVQAWPRIRVDHTGRGEGKTEDGESC
jgi:hypothetical protein